MATATKTKPAIKLRVPEPDDDESRDDFLDRCITEMTDDNPDMDAGDIESACDLAWQDRAAKAKVVRKTRASLVVRGGTGIGFVLSDESVDRYGDVIKADGWKLTDFKRNPIALFNHNASFPIGTWANLRVEDAQLKGDLELAPSGTSERIDEIRRLVEAGILRAVSVGFRPLTAPEPMDPDKPWGSVTHIKQELVETSLVSVPANANALAIAKGLKISPATLDFVFAGQGVQRESQRRGFTGGHAEPPNASTRKGTTMSASYAQRLTACEQRLNTLRDELEKHWETTDETNVSDDQLKIANDLNERIAREERTLTALREAERHLAATADDGHGRALVVTTAARPAAAVPAVAARPFSMGAKKISPIDLLVRAGTIQLLAHRERKPMDEVRRTLYGDHEETRAVLDWQLRAATTLATTTQTGWAAELVQQVVADFMATLLPKSVFPRLSAAGISLTFGRNGKVVIPTRSRTPTIAGSFVGEGQPIPVRQGAFTSQILIPKKMAVITTWTRELDEHSQPAIEGLLKNAIGEDTAVSLDAVLLDANPATTVRPAGILNGVAALTATAAGGFNALVGDIKQLSGALLTGTAGNVRNPVWLMNPQQINSAGLIAMPGVGVFPFREEIGRGQLGGWGIIDSGTVPLGTVIAMDAADYVSVNGEGPRFELSDQATLHMEDTTPLDIGTAGTPAVVAAPVKSMWQTDSIALRLILPVNWTIRRAGTVAWVQGVTW